MIEHGTVSSAIHGLPPSNSFTGFLFPSGEVKPHKHCIQGPAEAREYVESLCQACGLRILHLWLNSSTWVPRRVEHVQFVDEKTVRRQVTVDFSVPGYAPVIEMGGQDLELVPLALLRKKTLVNFDLRDEQGRSLSLLSLRQNQAVTAAALHGVAASIPDAPWSRLELPEPVKQLLNALIFGDKHCMAHAHSLLHSEAEFRPLLEDDLFSLTTDRLLRSWLMVLMLPARQDVRRIVKFGYDEPLNLRSREQGWHPDMEEDDKQPPSWFGMVRESLGFRPVRIRLPIPGAESAQSYHIGITAPPGVEIRSGQALAARLGDASGSPPIERTDETVVDLVEGAPGTPT